MQTDSEREKTEDTALPDDILVGAAEIGPEIKSKPRRVYALVAKDKIPHFRLGDIICARKSTLRKWIEQQERTA